MTETDWAYLAGLIDGGGDITILHTVRVRICNTDMGIIGWLQKHFPEIKTRTANSNVEWNGRNAIEVLTKTLPYLQGKKRKLTELALAFLDYVDDSRSPHQKKERLGEFLLEVAVILNS